MTAQHRTPRPAVGSLCTGYGGLDLGVLAALGGGRLVWCADPDPHIRVVLDARWPGVPNHDDIRDIDWRAVEPVDVLTAGFPCQDISSAGQGAGIQEGNHSGLWYVVMDAVRHLRPALVVLENVAALRWRASGLGIVLGELAAAGYDACWRSVRASDIGAPHRRERVFLLAWPAHSAGRARQFAAAALAGRSPRPLAATAAFDRRGVGEFQPAPAQPAGRQQPHQPHIDTPPPVRARTRTGGPDPDREPAERAGQPAAAGSLDWGPYEPAIRRWEHIQNRPAPDPIQRSAHDRQRLAPVFVEWLMGLPAGWVTNLGLPWKAQIRALGDGAVPHQADAAVRCLLADVLHHTAQAPTLPSRWAA